MRLFEVEGRFVNDLTLIIRNLVGRIDSTDDPRAQHVRQPLTYPAVSHMLGNIGYGEMTPELMKKLYDKNDDIKKLILDPEETGDEIVLKTDSEKEKQQVSTQPGPDISQMATQGANKYQSDISK